LTWRQICQGLLKAIEEALVPALVGVVSRQTGILESLDRRIEALER
jgi:hypothetical protein